MATIFERRPEGATESRAAAQWDRWSAGGSNRILVALDGRQASLPTITAALHATRLHGRGVDILVYSCGKTLPPLLMYFFDQLQRNGFHFDLYCRSASLGTAIAEFSGRRRPSLILVDSLDRWEAGDDPAAWQLRVGCPVYELSER